MDHEVTPKLSDFGLAVPSADVGVLTVGDRGIGSLSYENAVTIRRTAAVEDLWGGRRGAERAG